MTQPPRIVFHPGFHKTGTTSLQKYIDAHKAALTPYFTPYIHMGAAGPLARYYGHKQFPWRLWAFRRELRRFLKTVPAEGTILLSRETFCGVMPGHHGIGGKLIRDYQAAAKPLCAVTLQELRRRFGPDLDLTFLFTTRERRSWLRSVYGHLLRSYRVTEDFDAWAAQFDQTLSLEDEARQLAAHFPDCKLETRALEEFGSHNCGMAACVLELMGVPAEVIDALPPARRENAGKPADVAAELLRLNRSPIGRKALIKAKEKLLAGATG
jgi:hypothetical protein